ncbi:hypothetical protein Tco_0116115 [Tanacetum coccineum]
MPSSHHFPPRVVQVRKNGLLVVAIGLQVVAPDEISTPTKAVRMRVGTEAGSSSSNKLRTINEKIVRMRGKGDGSIAYMYPSRRVPIGFGVSWNPVDGKDMLGCYKNHWLEEMHNIKGGWLLKGKDNKCSRTSSTRTSAAGSCSLRTSAAAGIGIE